jgi:hypothetical protein
MKKSKQKNSMGGARKGAGRKPTPPVLIRDDALKVVDATEFPIRIMQDEEVPIALRGKAAMKAVDYQRTLKTSQRDKKKLHQQESAEAAVTTGRFAPQGPPGNGPRLSIVK